MKTLRILFIAPSSYPIYGAESNVNAKVIKLLTESGCIIDLVSRAPRMSRNFYPPSDFDMVFSKLNSINVVKVDTNKDFKTILRHFRTLLKTGYIYKAIDWSAEAIKECEQLIKVNNYDFIYTYDYPSEVVGLYLTKKYSIKWVATWNDPYIWIKYPKPYGCGIKAKVSLFRRKLIADIGKHVYRNVFPSERLRDYMLSYMTNMNIASCVISPHIILKELEQENSKPLGEILKIIHAGALGKERDPKTLLQGLKLFLTKHSDAKIKFSFLGIFERMNRDYFTDLIQEYGLDSYIERIPPVPYADSLRIIKDYDVCMLIEAPCEVGIFLPSKIMDYMQNNKPILALSPMIGTINDMFRNKTIDYFADVNKPVDIAQQIEKLYGDFRNGAIGIQNKNCDTYKNEAIITTHLEKIFE